MATADSTTAPAPANASATVLLPLPARPTRPRMNKPSPARSRRSVDIEPRRAAPGADLERHTQRDAALHLRAHQHRDRLRLGERRLEQQLVMHLEEQPRRRARAAQRSVHAYHREL